MKVVQVGREKFAVRESSAGGFNVFKVFGKGPQQGSMTFVASAPTATEAAVKQAVARGRAAGEI
jgi:hypothetical protein